MPRITIKQHEKVLETTKVLLLLKEFIRDSNQGKRTKKNGSRISQGTIRNYTYLMKAIESHYSGNGKYSLSIHILEKASQKKKEQIAHFYKAFYNDFTDHLFSLGYFDNYVGLIVKCLRSFFNYLILERNLNLGSYHKQFYVYVEQISIIALSPSQLRYIIHDPDFISKVNNHGLSEIRNIFLFGCCVALRVSDLLSLTEKNLIRENGNTYLSVRSKKSRTDTKVKLPHFALEILETYKGRQRTLLPKISKAYLNTRIKDMAQLFEGNFELVKFRERRGKQVVVYKNPDTKTNYTLADHICTHTMRRTGITSMLSLGMPEYLVRKVSGHSANSKEFFRYVELAQHYLDEQTDLVFNNLADVTLDHS